MKTTLIVSTLLAIGAGCATAAEQRAPASTFATVAAKTASFADFQLEILPEWTNVWGNDVDAFFDINSLMKEFALSRMQATEVQNIYRDLLRPIKEDLKKITGLANVPDSKVSEQQRQQAFDSALSFVQSGQFENLKSDELKRKKFIVVFDLDATLYDQTVKADNACADIQQPKKILTAKNFPALMHRISDLGGGIVLFSANKDAQTIENLNAWKIDGKSLWEHPQI